ncbi:DUF6531 domain-containing protein [Streptomyces nondiastaticus]|uniref:DUF6531 domain-containing protein n=1 Tax=Streptomyces nondiastaticus TaxID=3154512 RepID=A0ABW6TYC2_9ACTN
MRADPVNTATGAFTECFMDARVAGIGATLDVKRTYSSGSSNDGMLGKGWLLPWEVSLTAQSNGDFVLRGEGGAQHLYKKDRDGTFSTPLWARSKLTAEGNVYRLKIADQHVYEFNNSGQLVSLKDRSGQGLTITREDGRISKITDAVGRSASLAYTGNRLEKFTLADGRTINYGYSGDRLVSVTAPDGAKETYDYDAAGRLSSITDARGKIRTANTYDTQGRVVSQKDALDSKTSFSYEKNGPFDKVDITAPDGGVWTDIYYSNVLFTQLDPFGNTSSYQYDSNFNRTGVIDAENRLTSSEFGKTSQKLTDRWGASQEHWRYDGTGNLTEYTDGTENKTKFSYNSKNQLLSVQDALEKTSTFTYRTDSGLLETATSPHGKVTRYGYDSVGNRTSITTAEGNKTTFTYDASGRVMSVTDPRGNSVGADPAQFTTTFTYDPADRVKAVRDAQGNITSYDYDAVGNLVKVTNPKAQVTQYTYDDAGRQIKVTDSAGKTTTTGYDKVGRIISITDRTAATTTFVYDKAGNRIEVTTARGNATEGAKADYTWTVGYDKVGNRKTVTDPLGKTTAFNYNSENLPTSVTDPLGHTRTVAYDRNGSVIRVTDGLEEVTADLTYDSNHRLVSSADQYGEATKYEYDDDGNLTAEVTPEGERTTYSYDGDGQRTSMVDPRGNAPGADPGKYTWKYDHDAAGHVTSVTNPLGHKHATSYDAVGNVVSTTDARGKQTSYKYDELRRVSKVVSPSGGTTSYNYDTAGFLASKTDANQHVKTYSHDAEGRLLSVTDAMGRSVNSLYDAEGNRSKVINARGQIITLTTDARGLATKVSYSDGTPATTVKYDDASRPVEVADATGTRTLTYFNDDQLASVTSPGAPTAFQYTYNKDGSLKYRYDPLGGTTRYSYDKNDRVKEQKSESGSVTYDYDAAGNMLSVKLPTKATRGEARTYDEAGRLSSNTTPAGTYTYDRDPDGRIVVSRKANGYPTRYAYDDTGRLSRTCTDTSAASCLNGNSGSTFSYDAVGNFIKVVSEGTATTRAYDDADQLKTSSTGNTVVAYDYDADGNQTKSGTYTYTYDPAGRIKSANFGTNSFSFLYDADGNRVATKKNGTLDRTTRWDSNNPLPLIAGETSGSGALLDQYQYDPSGMPISMTKSGSANYYFTRDQQGSIQGVFDSAGTENYRYTYSVWGKATGSASATGGQPSPFGFTGQFTDPSLPDRLLLRARSYDVTQGRFTSPDPVPAEIRNPNTSPYNYSNNDPVNQSDPSGMCPMCVSAAIGGVIGGVVGGTTYTLTHQGEFSWSDFASATGKSAAVGAGAGLLAPVGGGFAASLGLSGGRALAVSTTVNAGVGMGYTWAVNTSQCQPTTPTDLLLSGLGGASTSLIGPAWRWGKNLLSSPSKAAGPSGLTLDMPAYGPSPRGAAGKKPAVVETYEAPSAWSHAGQLTQAESLLESFALKNFSSKTGTRTYAGGYNIETGEIAIASSGGKFPGVSYCAEGNVCFALGGDAAKIRFTNAYTVEKVDGNLVVSLKPVCASCQIDYPSPFQFQSGIQHGLPGSWDSQNY